jgi:hypothetical protein
VFCRYATEKAGLVFGDPTIQSGGYDLVGLGTKNNIKNCLYLGTESYLPSPSVGLEFADEIGNAAHPRLQDNNEGKTACRAPHNASEVFAVSPLGQPAARTEKISVRK